MQVLPMRRRLAVGQPHGLIAALLRAKAQRRTRGRRVGRVDDGGHLVGRELRFQPALGQGADGALGVDGRSGVGGASRREG